MVRFSYLEPETIEEAIFLLNKHGEKARVIAGGTDLLVQMKNKAIYPEYVIDIEYIPGLAYIEYDEEQGLTIGALTTIRALETSTLLRQRYPIVSQAASQLGSVAIRNVASVGGNLCNAAPSAETAPALIALAARVKILGSYGERVVPLEDFFLGPGTTVLQKGELLVEIQVPLLPSNTKSSYLKYSMRGTIDLAIVNVAVVLTPDLEAQVYRDIKIVLGAVAPTPIRARHAEEVVRGKKINRNVINQSAQAASDESQPISDVRSTAEYRREIVKVLTRRAIKEATIK